MQTIHYQRKPRQNANYSLEAVFEDVRNRLAPKRPIAVRIAPYISNGIVSRYRIIQDVCQVRDQLLHITGDISFAALGASRRSSILTIPDCGFVRTKKGIRRWLLKQLWLSLPVKNVSAITTISHVVKDEICTLAKVPESKVHVVHVAITPRFQPMPNSFSSTPKLLQLGTAPNKNIPRLMEAIAGLNVHLTIVGNLDPELLEKARLLGVSLVNKTGLNNEEILEEYNQCDIVVFPSTYEGFGMPILEGQAVGRPVLTSRVSSMPEVAGNSAFLVDPFDVQSIRNGIEQLLASESLRNHLVAKGFDNIKRFDGDAIANQYNDIYESVESSLIRPKY